MQKQCTVTHQESRITTIMLVELVTLSVGLEMHVTKSGIRV